MALERITSLIRKAAFWCTGIFLALYLLAWTFEDRVGPLVLGLVRQELATELEVGDFRLSFIRAFPRIQGSFRDVRLADAHGDTLLTCSRLAVALPWSVLWSDETRIRSLALEGGTLNLAINREGKPNWLVFKEKDDDSPSSFMLHVGKAVLEDMQLVYADHSAGRRVEALVDKASLKGKFGNDRVEADHDLRGSLVSWVESGTRRFGRLDLLTDGHLDIDIPANRYRLSKTRLELNGMECNLEGLIEPGADGTYVDLEAGTGASDAAELWQLVAPYLPAKAAALRPEGTASLAFRAKGRWRSDRFPEIRATLSWQDGRLAPESGPALEAIALQLQWEQPLGMPYGDGQLRIVSGNARVAGQPLRVSGDIRRLNDPLLDLHLDGSLPVALIHGAELQGEGGLVHCEGMVLRGSLNPGGLQATGNVRLESAALRYRQDPMLVGQGRIGIANGSLSVADLQVTLAGSTLSLDGQVGGLIEQFGDPAVPVPVTFDGTIRSESLDVEALMRQFDRWKAPSATTQANAGAAAPSQAFTQCRGSLAARIGRFTYGEVNGRNFDGKVTVDGRRMLLSGDADAMKGSFNLEGELRWGQGTVWEGALTCERVDVREAFRQCRNFGQEFLTDRQLGGTLSTQLVFDARWDEQGRFQPEKLHVYSAMQIDQGELVGMEMLESFSRFVHLSDLRHVKFSTLQNYFEVVDGKVYLPRMLIRSNAMVLEVTGLHGFDQSIDYSFGVNAGQVLINKITRHDPTLAPKPGRRSGWSNLYYHLRGTTDDFSVKADRDRVQDDFRRSAFHRTRIRTALEETFGSLLFSDEEADAVELTNSPVPSGTAADMPERTSSEPMTPAQRLVAPYQQSQRRQEPEYLEGMQIEGGAGKRGSGH